MFSDLHVHTCFSDGKNSPEQCILRALELNMCAIGFSDHAYIDFDGQYCMKRENIPVYREEILRLREKYRGKIDVLYGIEQDSFSYMPTDDYDYVIGSVHYLKVDGEYLPVDETPALLSAAVDKHFDGNIYAYIEAYYEAVGNVIADTGADIVGHFDLITKFNEKGDFFDPASPRYIKAWKSAADKLLKTGAVFEINSGAISRGYRTAPYPAPEILAYLKQGGARFILSGDSHSAAGLCCAFNEIYKKFGKDYDIILKPENLKRSV